MQFQAKLSGVTSKHAQWLNRLIVRGYRIPIADLGRYKNYTCTLTLTFKKVGADYYCVFNFDVEQS